MAVQKKTRPIKTAVLGLGRSGWNIHVNDLRNRKEFEITDVADPLEERRREAERELGCRTYAEVSDLLAASRAELVVVATKSIDHCAHAVAALEAGKHVVVEKPMAMSHAEALRMVETARKRKRKLFVHQNRRFDDDVQYFKLLCSGKTEIGRVFSVVFQDYSFARRNDWQTLKKYGGGVLNNKLTHFLDQILYMTGSRVKALLCDMQHTTDSGDCEDHVMILLKMENGISVAVISSTSCNADAPTWIFMGEYGTVSVFRDHAEMRYFNPKKHRKLPVRDTVAADGRRYGNEEKLRWYTRKNLKLKAENIGGFYDNVIAVLRRRAKMVVTPESVVEMTRVIEECRKQNPLFLL